MSYCESCGTIKTGVVGYFGLLGYSIIVWTFGIVTQKMIMDISMSLIFLWFVIGCFGYSCLVVHVINVRRKLKVVNNK